MQTKASKIIAIIFLSIASLFSLTPSTTYAVDICTQANVSQEVKEANGCYGNTTTELKDTIVSIVNSVILVLGLVATVFIVIGGVNYMTSAGDSGKLKKAKDTILWAVVGLIIAVLAFAIVNFVIANILGQ